MFLNLDHLYLDVFHWMRSLVSFHIIQCASVKFSNGFWILNDLISYPSTLFLELLFFFFEIMHAPF
jgi:hypothetical protein